jgi:hypothetical protein
MSNSRRKEPLFLKALEELASLIFEELDLGLSDYIWSQLGKHGELIELLLFVYRLNAVNPEPIIEVIQDCDLTFEDVYCLNFWSS